MKASLKFTPGQTVQLLNTEFKPVCTATVIKYDSNTGRYEVEYKYPDPNKTEVLSVPPERLTVYR